jgi:uncharacterized protein YraI
VTATLAVTQQSAATTESSTATPLPTTAPIEGRTTTQLYVRAEPFSAGAAIALAQPGTMLQIIGKDPGGNWYQVLQPEGPDGRGWAFAKYVEVKDAGAIPLIGGAPGPGSVAGLIQQVNVRSGPGTDFDSLGTLNATDAVTLLGKDAGEQWLQIKYAPAADGKGWVAASFLQNANMDSLPVIGESGQVLGTSTPPPAQATRAPKSTPAPVDGDSPEAPAVTATFSPLGSAELIYSSDISAPEGDSADWVGFTPYYDMVRLRLDCEGSGMVATQLLRASTPVANWGKLECGDTLIAHVKAGAEYVLKIEAIAKGNTLRYVKFTLTIDANP